MTEEYGNPSSTHLKGVEAERVLRDAREEIASTLRCSEKEIFFTSGGTEADNWALIGGAGAHARAGKHLITTAIEHEAVLEPMKYLESRGFRVTRLPVDHNGYIRPQDLEEALDDETILVSVMYVNNEVGSIQPVEECLKIVKERCPQALFHVDAVQAYGKIPINLKKTEIDLMSVSGHKIHGPKGTGFLYIREKTRILPLILGGVQQKGMRSGTDNVPGAAGLACAAAQECGHMAENTEQMRVVKKRLTDGLRKLEDVVIHSGDDERSAPHIVNAAFPGIRSEVLLHALEDREIYVSAGSACSSNRSLPVSRVLQEMGLPRRELESSLRFSFSKYNTTEEADRTIRALAEYLPVLRRYQRH